MLHAYVWKFDVMSALGIFLTTKHGLSILSFYFYIVIYELVYKHKILKKWESLHPNRRKSHGPSTGQGIYIYIRTPAHKSTLYYSDIWIFPYKSSQYNTYALHLLPCAILHIYKYIYYIYCANWVFNKLLSHIFHIGSMCKHMV